MDIYWVANYDDGEKLEQFDKDGTENKYADIDRFKLMRFDMVDKVKKRPIYSVYLNDGQRLIYRRRTLINSATGERIVVYLVGWQMTVYTNSGPRNISAINYIHEDGSISLDNDRSNIELLQLER